MINIRDIIREKGIKVGGVACREKLTLEGHVYNQVYGWEKPEVLERFGLDPNMAGVPCRLYDEFDFKETRRPKKDSYGNKTGEYEIIQEKVKTSRQIWGPTENYLAYREELLSEEKRKAANSINRIPLPIEEF